MNTYAQVKTLIAEWKKKDISKPELVVNAANACMGWPYIYGDRGTVCTAGHRKAVYNSHPEYPNLINRCQRLKQGESTCVGCKWYPGGETLGFDCRGFTYWLHLQVGITINGAGATSQWNDSSNWAAKGTIATMPKDKVCCVFRYNKATGKMAHTLLYDGEGNYIHCSGEVKKQKISTYGATHWAIPKGLYGDIPMPTPTPTPEPEKGTATVTGKRVALRSGPSTKASIITRIDTGKVVKLEQVPDEWEYVSYNGKTGYMMKEFLDVRR